MLGQDDYYAWGYEDPTYIGGQTYEEEITPPAWVSEWVSQYQPGEVAAAGGGFFDIMKSIVSVVSPIATSILKAYKPTFEIPGFTPIVTKPAAATTAAAPTTVSTSIASIMSNPLLLAGIGLGAFMLLRKKGGKKRRRR